MAPSAFCQHDCPCLLSITHKPDLSHARAHINAHYDPNTYVHANYDSDTDSDAYVNIHTNAHTYINLDYDPDVHPNALPDPVRRMAIPSELAAYHTLDACSLLYGPRVSSVYRGEGWSRASDKRGLWFERSRGERHSDRVDRVWYNKGVRMN